MRFLFPCFRILGLAAALAAALAGCGQPESRSGSESPPVPVQVVPVTTGKIIETRQLSGTLRAGADFMVAPKVAGQVRELKARLADTIDRGDIVVLLDDEPFVQEKLQAEADLRVAEANLAEARAQAEIAKRGMERLRQLSESGYVSDTEYDASLTNQLSAEASVEVAEAQIARAEAFLESARLRLGYTRVRAEWTGGDKQRVVAERYIDEGDTVSVNQRLLRIVDLDPLLAVVNVTESDYPSIRPGDAVSVQTDAFPGRTFAGEVIRIAPVFSEFSRQAAVEFHVPNEDRLLRPGMFVRASLVLQEREGVTLIPQAALVRRGNRDGVFLIKPGAETVAWQPVETGIAEAERIEVRSPGLEGRVVTLGQQLLEDGTRVQVREEAIPAP